MKPTVVDIVQNALSDQPAAAKEALADVMLDKIRERLQDKREELAHTFYGHPDPEDEEEETEEEDEDFEDDEGDEDYYGDDDEESEDSELESEDEEDEDSQ
jgi:hypothetical protein